MWGSKLKTLALVLAVAGVAACGDDSIAPTDGGRLTLIPVVGDYYAAIPGAVKVCAFDLPGSFTTSANPGGDGTATEGATNLINGECSITWLQNTSNLLHTVTVTQTGPPGFDLRRLFVNRTDGFTLDYIDPDGCNGDVVIPTSESIDVGGANDLGAVFWFKQCPALPPPPGECNGLTPGFWKNYQNHYTEPEFALLIDGTAFPSLTNAQAKTILSTNNPAIPRLRKFLLANMLTVSLSNHPELDQKGSLSPDCDAGGGELGDLITIALDMLANPQNYTNQQILDMGTLLDAIANL